MTTAFFCFINGYELTITDDAPEFTKEIAKRTADDSNHDTATEIQYISDWLKPRSKSNLGLRFTFYLMNLNLPKDATEGVIFESRPWQTYYKTWYNLAKQRLARHIK